MRYATHGLPARVCVGKGESVLTSPASPVCCIPVSVAFAVSVAAVSVAILTVTDLAMTVHTAAAGDDDDDYTIG